MEETEVIIAYGHELIQSTHRTTFEITREKHLTKRGECIIAVNSNKAAINLSQSFKEAARKPNSEITITIEAGEEKETVKAIGNRELSFTHLTDMVIRKSSYICSRTIAIKADKAARDLSRKLIEKLRSSNQMIKITLTANIPN